VSHRYILRVSSVCVTGAVLLLALVPVGMCQTTPVQKEEPAPPDTIDEITVYGDKSMRVLRQELFAAEDNAYAVFNMLNDDAEYVFDTADVSAMIVPFAPTQRFETAKLFFVSALQSANKRIWLSAPYFVPDPAVMTALELAALRGVDVRIITTGKPDSWPVFLAAFHYISELRDLGFDGRNTKLRQPFIPSQFRSGSAHRRRAICH